MSEQTLDIFNLNIEDFQKEDEQHKGSGLYKTDPKEGKDSIFRATVRFLPNPKNPTIKGSSLKKYTYWLEDSQGNAGYFDCPTSIGEKSIIADLYWKLSKSDSARDKKASERLSRKEYYFSLVYIIKDPQVPENEGTIQVWRYPKQVRKLIDAQIKPSKEDMEMDSSLEPCNIFDLTTGKDFAIKVCIKGGFWNYDDCAFSKGSTPLKVNGESIVDSKSARATLKELVEKAPDLSTYEYKPWNDDQRKKLNVILSEIAGNPGADYSAISEGAKNEKSEVKNESVVEPSGRKENQAEVNFTNKNEQSESQEQATGDDELEDFLNKLDQA